MKRQLITWILTFLVVFIGYVAYDQFTGNNIDTESNENTDSEVLLCGSASDCVLSYVGDCGPCVLEYYECVSPEEAERRDDERELIPPEERPACTPCLEETVENFTCICINSECLKKER